VTTPHLIEADHDRRVSPTTAGVADVGQPVQALTFVGEHRHRRPAGRSMIASVDHPTSTSEVVSAGE